ncbi:MAG: pyruvate, phosphate dikinase [Dehalococcoidia bacterium]|jgi:pyruvate,orthophosphate dikinase
MGYIYSFNDGVEDKSLLGNKGANLVTMTKLKLPVPPGFVVSVEGYNEYKKTGRLSEKEITQAVADLEKQAHAKLGKGLQVSVRSSAPASMPGMMDTVLNISGLSEVRAAIRRIFESWDNLRAIEYRRINNISSDMGTAAVVQAMVFGNKDAKSGTGVVFSRNPSTGEKGLFGEYIQCAQGEAIVSGSTTPVPVSKLEAIMPKMYKELLQKVALLEAHFRDMQDIEFTIESEKLYILQTRSGKRSGQAAVKIVVDMVHEDLITVEEAILRVKPDDLRAILHKHIKPGLEHEPLTKGLAAAPGAVSGRVVFTVDEAMLLSKKSIPSILVRQETSPDDIQGIAAADGVLTSRGGLTSHAAIVTRAMGKPCVCGAEDIEIDPKKKLFTSKGKTVHDGDTITIDGTAGTVYIGTIPLEEGTMIKEFTELLTWLDGAKRLGVRANADMPEMVAQAIKLGAEGIGLCRTERQFNGPERLSAIREYIMAETAGRKAKALEHLSKLQKEDFIVLFKELKGLPIIIRLLDLPLHEFLPSETETTDPKTKQRIAELKEINPMLGHRGVRVAVTNPEIYRMQVEAIEAAKKEVPADVSIMIPQVITLQELIMIKKSCTEGSTLKLGTMMETVRACMRAGRLAEVADFLSFGTNDLTQAVYSFSREDAEKKFLSTYLEIGILEDNPFEIIDIKGVGRLMETAIFWARRAKKDIPIGVCGEQAGEPTSIKFFHAINVDYVSCSPFRVPIAKLTAAQAAIEQKDKAESIL